MLLFHLEDEETKVILRSSKVVTEGTEVKLRSSDVATEGIEVRLRSNKGCFSSVLNH